MSRRRRSFAEEFVKAISVNRCRVEIRVNDDGFFIAHVAGEYVKEETMAALVTRVKSLTRKTKIVTAVPVSVLNSGDVNDVVLTGFDAAGNVLYKADEPTTKTSGSVRWRRNHDHGRLDSITRGYGLEGLARRLTKTERAEYAALVDAHQRAEQARDAWVEKRAIKNAKALVDAAIAEQVDTPVESADESADPR